MTISCKFGVMILSASSMVFAAEIGAPTTAAQMVVTIQSKNANRVSEIRPDDLKVYQGDSRRVVTSIEHLSGELGGMELLIYVDDAIDPASFDALQPELDRFIRALPETTKVTTDEKPVREAGTYTNLLKLMRTWSLNSETGRRAVLIISDGVARENVTAGDDPLVQAAWRNAQISGIGLYTIFVPTSRSNASEELDDAGQSNLFALSAATGGQSYHSEIGALYSILQDLNERLENQYRVTFQRKQYAGRIRYFEPEN